ncbi:MAG: hypothetical protein AAFU65_14085 [Pseudomonadota bacterium]
MTQSKKGPAKPEEPKAPDTYRVLNGIAGAGGRFKIPQGAYITVKDGALRKRLINNGVIAKAPAPTDVDVISYDDRREFAVAEQKRQAAISGAETAAA